MKLKNKKTGEIVDADFNATISGRTNIIIIQNGSEQLEYGSLAELNEEWEDAPEEPKEYWYINEFGTPAKADFVGRETLYDKCRKNFGNYFETEEEAELAVRKLKAWKRLKNKGFKFDRWENDNLGDFVMYAHTKDLTDIVEDLDLLFCTEENS